MGRPEKWLPSFTVLYLLLVNAPIDARATSPGGAGERDDLTIDPGTITAAWKGDLDRMVERRVIRVLVVPSKTFYFNDKGTQRGITYDSFQVIEQELHKQLLRDKKLKRKNLRVKFFFIPVRRDRIFTALAAGQGDIAAANLTITAQRRQQVDFAKPILTNTQEVVVTAPGASPLGTLDDLAGKQVFVRRSSSYYEHLLELNKRLLAARKPPVRLKAAPEELEDEDLIEMLNAKLVSALVVDQHVARFWKKVFPSIRVHDDLVVGSGGEIAWAIRKGSPQLKAFLDGIAVASTSGHLADEREIILARYLKRLTYVRSATADAARKRFLALLELFRKYGDRYDVDPLLMAAQGYQESRLNQNARSPSGAIGVMQILPATGRELKVGDIRKVDPNIHAGAKYVRFMVDQYYAREPMTDLDKALFTFASYNAGARRVAQLRTQAKQRGLDANVWFHNVEYVAEEKTGAETVTYVGNIYKYYVAYRLLDEALQARRSQMKEVRARAQ
ncbi:MAG TPA: lytic transglycosylase F [Steroidobacteraceae bacterium]|nr:lytic transglycosylase F [Steroidobacteraceae bacterium]